VSALRYACGGDARPGCELPESTIAETPMIWGMTVETFTLVHVVLSLVGIAAGLIVMFGMLTGKRLDGWTVLFLATTAATSITGFAFPFDHLSPAHRVGIVSLVALGVAVLARYGRHLQGSWRRVYVVSAATALYLNAFVGVVQAFMKDPGAGGTGAASGRAALPDRPAGRAAPVRRIDDRRRAAILIATSSTRAWCV